jgi:hypothetical protein
MGLITTTASMVAFLNSLDYPRTGSRCVGSPDPP